MKLIVCGDSFAAVSRMEQHRGGHYSEILASQLKWDLINLARQGCSNGGIRIQIDAAIRERPDLVIVSPTFWDRMEIPASAAPYDPAAPAYDQWGVQIDMNKLQTHLQNVNLKNGYDPAAGIDNVNYGTNDYRMICETIFSLADNLPHPYRSSQIDKTTQQAMKMYVNCLYDSNWKKQMDQWIIRDGLMQLHLAGIPFIVTAGTLFSCEELRAFVPDCIGDDSLTLDPAETAPVQTDLHRFSGEDPGYHGGPESQHNLAQKYIFKIRKLVPWRPEQ